MIAWLFFEIPSGARFRAAIRIATGSLVPIVMWGYLVHKGLAGAGTLYASYLALRPGGVHIALIVGTLLVAWPCLPLGLLRARASERAGALVDVLFLLFYGYDYIGPNVAATLVVGTRLLLPTVVLLLPGYVEILSYYSATFKTWFAVSLLIVALASPPVLMSVLAERREVLDERRISVLRQLRPGCAVGYTPFGAKLLLPFPKTAPFISVDSIEELRNHLRHGDCVDLIAPRFLLTTHQGSFADPGFFNSLTRQFPNCSFELAGAERIIRLNPIGQIAQCY